MIIPHHVKLEWSCIASLLLVTNNVFSGSGATTGEILNDSRMYVDFNQSSLVYLSIYLLQIVCCFFFFLPPPFPEKVEVAQIRLQGYTYRWN